MNDATDMDLLRQYAAGNSDAAFAVLVSRHVNMVYSAALRKAGNPHAAEEITQAVFIILAKKAGRISDKTILPGWLYQTARLTAAGFLKREARRARREHEVYMQTEPHTAAPDETWEQLAPLLEDAMGQLGEKDRAVVMLRFFGGKSFADVGAAVGVSENAAKKRVNYALEKLHRYFAKLGVSSTATIIAGAISANSVQAAPVGLAKTISVGAIAKGAMAGGSTLTLVNGALKVMAWTKVRTSVIISVILAACITSVMVKQVEEHRANMWEVQEPTLDLLRKTTPQVKIVPTKFQSSRWLDENGDSLGIAQSLKIIIGAAHGMWATQVILDTPLPQGRYDVIANLPQSSPEALQQEIKNQFGVVASREMREEPVLLLRVKTPDTDGLKQHGIWSDPAVLYKNGEYFWNNKPLSDLAGQLGFYFNMPVIDETGLEGNFDFNLKWDWKNPDPETMKQDLLEQLGLELVPARKPIEVLVVKKAN